VLCRIVLTIDFDDLFPNQSPDIIHSFSVDHTGVGKRHPRIISFVGVWAHVNTASGDIWAVHKVHSEMVRFIFVLIFPRLVGRTAWRGALVVATVSRSSELVDDSEIETLAKL